MIIIKNIIKTLHENLFSKVTFFTVAIHWMLVILAVYERGGLSYRFHFFYEPILFKIIVLLNLPTLIISDSFVSGNAFIDETHLLRGTLILILSITAQWLIIGCVIKQIFFNKKVQVI